MNPRNWMMTWAILAGLLAASIPWLTPPASLGAMAPQGPQTGLNTTDGDLDPADDLFLDDPPPGTEDDQEDLDRQPPDRPAWKERGPRERRPGRPAREAGGDGSGGPPTGPLAGPPEEMIGRAMEILRAKLPAVHARMQKLQRRSPDRFMQAMQRLMPIVMEYVSLRDENPGLADTIFEEFKIEERLRQLSKKFKEAKDKPEDQAALGQEIEKLVREQIELRRKRQVARLEDFERRIREQQARLEEQRAKFQDEMKRRDELVASRVQEVKEGKVGDPLRPIGPRPRGPEGEMRRPVQRGPVGPDGPGDPPRLPPPPRPGDEDRPPPPPTEEPDEQEEDDE